MVVPTIFLLPVNAKIAPGSALTGMAGVRGAQSSTRRWDAAL